MICKVLPGLDTDRHFRITGIRDRFLAATAVTAAS